jgi:hypothetical protein
VNPSVRTRVAANRSLPPKLVNQLLADEDRHVAQAAVDALTHRRDLRLSVSPI